MRISLFALMLFLPGIVLSNEAHVIAANVEHIGGSYFKFNVTVQHQDEDWEHFAKAWEVLDEDGMVLGARILLHPHVKEQPFTRSHTINIPEHVEKVTIRAYDLIHKFGGKEITLELNRGNKNEVN